MSETRFAAAPTWDGELLERAELRSAAGAVIGALPEGRGRVVVFEGPPGAGKSTLLAAVTDAAAGASVAWARPTEAERSFAFATAGRLLRSLTGARCAEQWESRGRGVVSHAVFAGAFKAVEGAAARRPQLLVIDDAERADDASIAWISYLAARLGDVPIAVLLATRPVDPREHEALGRLLAMRDDVDVLAVRPLSAAAVRATVARRLGAGTAARVWERAFHVTGGNPFLLAELIHAWRAAGETGGLPVSPGLRRAVSLRIAQLGDDATALAGAVAVLGGIDVAPHDAAALAELEGDRARRAADRLAASGVLASGTALAFAQPLVGEAVHLTVAPIQRAAWHARAAGLLAARGRETGDVAPHLLAAHRTGDRWVVQRLRAAAADAVAGGAPAMAASFLRRALEEPPRGHLRTLVVCELAEAAARAGAPDAEACLRAALAATRDRRAAMIGLRLGRLMMSTGREADASAVLHQALGDAGARESELGLHLRIELVGVFGAQPGLRQIAALPAAPSRAPSELRGHTARERALLAALAYQAAAGGVHAGVVRSLAERAVAGNRLWDDTGMDTVVPYAVSTALWSVDQHAAALAHLDTSLDRARRRGSAMSYALARAGRASVLVRTGRLADAEAEAADALAIAAELGLALVVPFAVCPLVLLRVERGELEAADEALATYGFDEEMPRAAAFAGVRAARGRIRSARGRHGEAAEDFLAAGAALLDAGTRSPALLPWRSDAALALAAAGDEQRAAELVAEELALARRAAAPRAIALALRADAMLGAPDRRVERLGASVRLLRSSGCRVELARVLVDLGAAALRAGDRDGGRIALREGLDVADRHGAHATAQRARAELAIAGARPRRARISGPEALTAAELRVVRLAAEGRSNRAIAAELFVSVKTVETHLGHAFMKLDVKRRGELAAVLAAPREAGP